MFGNRNFLSGLLYFYTDFCIIIKNCRLKLFREV